MEIHALWCHPRSVSTAFERIMRERDDMNVFHEPFMYHHYLNATDRMFPDFTPEPGHPTSYEDIRAMIREKAQAGPVFFKDMAYYIADLLPKDKVFVAQMTHAFLLRNPVEAAVSYARLDPSFARTELGHEAQHRLYHALVSQGHAPLVLTANQLRGDPKTTMRRYWAYTGLDFADHAFEWDDRVPTGWRSVENWHRGILQSRSIHNPAKSNAAAQLAEFGAPFTDYAEYHTPFYAELAEIAHRQAHQK